MDSSQMLLKNNKIGMIGEKKKLTIAHTPTKGLSKTANQVYWKGATEVSKENWGSTCSTSKMCSAGVDFCTLPCSKKEWLQRQGYSLSQWQPVSRHLCLVQQHCTQDLTLSLLSCQQHRQGTWHWLQACNRSKRQCTLCVFGKGRADKTAYWIIFFF